MIENWLAGKCAAQPFLSGIMVHVIDRRLEKNSVKTTYYQPAESAKGTHRGSKEVVTKLE
jgi:hypothetical protein